MNERVRWMVIAASCALALGCSSSKDTNSDTDAGSGGTGASGSGGTSSSGTGGTASGTGGTMAGTGGSMGAIAMNVPCGDTMCAGAAPGSMMGFPGFMLAQVCCADDATSTCGAISTDDMMCHPPPEPDPQCPTVMGGAGCCASNNVCGLDATIGGRGCLGLDVLNAMFGNLPPQIRMMFMFPEAVDCDGNPLPDAGMSTDDAGT